LFLTDLHVAVSSDQQCGGSAVTLRSSSRFLLVSLPIFFTAYHASHAQVMNPRSLLGGGAYLCVPLLSFRWVSEGVRICVSPLGDILAINPRNIKLIRVKRETIMNIEKMKPFRAHGVAVALARVL
jgi:hypothetical protein